MYSVLRAESYDKKKKLPAWILISREGYSAAYLTLNRSSERKQNNYNTKIKENNNNKVMNKYLSRNKRHQEKNPERLFVCLN